MPQEIPSSTNQIDLVVVRKMADVNDVKKSRGSTYPTLPATSGNKFTNDGSFMEMFKKQMEEKQRQNYPGKQQHGNESPGSATSSLCSNESCIAEKLQASSSSESTDKRTLKLEKKLNYSFFVGKRRGSAPVLKTGAVKKTRVQEEDEGAVKTDAWSRYLAEVQKYKSRSCQDEDRTRPLVK